MIKDKTENHTNASKVATAAEALETIAAFTNVIEDRFVPGAHCNI